MMASFRFTFSILFLSYSVNASCGEDAAIAWRLEATQMAGIEPFPLFFVYHGAIVVAYRGFEHMTYTKGGNRALSALLCVLTGLLLLLLEDSST